MELDHVLDVQGFYETHLPPSSNMNNLSKPHQLVIRSDPEAAGSVKSSISCRLWSDTPEKPPCHLLLSVPSSTPTTKAGRHMFFSLDGKHDFEKLYNIFQWEFENVASRFQFPEDVMEEWRKTFSWVEGLMEREDEELESF